MTKVRNTSIFILAFLINYINNQYKVLVKWLNEKKEPKENNGTVIFESEFEKFAGEYKDDVTSGKLDIEKFKNFCAATGALKKAGKKSSTGGDVSSNRRLNTPEAAIARGVVPEKIDAYIEGVNAIYAVSKVINALLTNARVSFAIPIEHPKAQEQVVETP